ncbi:hypothetical protein BY458DRAFT_537791 [Sporodiniella umbellata]|nr:hypothetical protein BY458DRAFT_537791 [Sporodiniella umbellata]
MPFCRRLLWFQKGTRVFRSTGQNYVVIESNAAHPKCLYSSTRALVQSWEEDNKKQTMITHDTITGSRLELLSKTLGSLYDPKALPPAWHHVYFPPQSQEEDLALDGYEREFFPPKPFSQRLWGGAGFKWNVANPLKVGDKIEMKTKLAKVDFKEGKHGESAIVWLNKDIYNHQGWSMREQRCLVYLCEQIKPASSSNGITMNKTPDFSSSLVPSSILLFRYSALTFNSHKIHYDHVYATEIEKHPACLVHGPLSGTLLLELLRNHKLSKEQLDSFEYRCLAPLYVNRQLNMWGRKIPHSNKYEVWITNDQGYLAVKGTATYKTV